MQCQDSSWILFRYMEQIHGLSFTMQETQTHLQPLIQDSPLPLNAHILGPLYKSVQVMLWCWCGADAWEYADQHEPFAAKAIIV